MVFFSLRARATSPDMNDLADSGIAAIALRI
jgi:hypothetical protein